jgi:hypothetical protein
MTYRSQPHDGLGPVWQSGIAILPGCSGSDRKSIVKLSDRKTKLSEEHFHSLNICSSYGGAPTVNRLKQWLKTLNRNRFLTRGLLIALMIEAASTSETSVKFY